MMRGIHTQNAAYNHHIFLVSNQEHKKDPSINKVLREEKEDIEALKYDASMILWYSKI